MFNSTHSFCEQDLEDFEIEPRLTQQHVEIDTRKLNAFMQSLLKQVEADFLRNHLSLEDGVASDGEYQNLVPKLVVSEAYGLDLLF